VPTRRLSLWLLGIFTLLVFSASYAQQQPKQLWLEHQLSYPFANRYLLENTTSYQTLLDKNDKWQSIAISPTFEYTLFPRFELLSEVPLAYTVQKVGTTSIDIMPMVGARYNITLGKRVDSKILLRYQHRLFRQIEADNWDVSNRTRLRGEVFASLNGPNMFTNKLWYLFGDYEEFFVFDHQVDERYAFRRRGRLGVGYRLSYGYRFELGYTWVSYRNEIDGDFVADSQVIQIKVKMFLNSGAPASR
jgi:hypothetical protein